MNEIGSALADIQAGGIDFELIGFDSSLMGMVEVAHTVAPFTKTFIASSQIGQAEGNNYNEALAILAENPGEVTGEVLASEIVATYKDAYSGQSTLSAFDTTQFPALSQTLADFSAALNELALRDDDWDQIKNARSGSTAFRDPAFRDLGQFMLNIANNETITHQSIRTAALAVHDQLRSMVIAEATNPLRFSGLSIYLPNNAIAPTYAGSFGNFTAQTGWLNSLNDFTTEPDSRAGSYEKDRFEGADGNDSITTGSINANLNTLAGSWSFDSLSIDTTTDIDWFRFSIATTGLPGSMVRVSHDNTVQGAADAMLITLVQITSVGGIEFRTQVGNTQTTVGGVAEISLDGLDDEKDYAVKLTAFDSKQNELVVPRYDLTINAPVVTTATDFAGTNGSAVDAYELVNIGQKPEFTGLFLSAVPAGQPPQPDWFSFQMPQIAAPVPPTLLRVRSPSSEAITINLRDAAQTLVASVSGTGLIELQQTLDPSATYFLEITSASPVDVNYAIDIQLPDVPAPPQVLDVGVSGSGWDPSLVSSLGPQGYFSIPVGAGEQLRPLPWTGIDQIHVLFSEKVIVGLGDLTLVGVNVSSYSLSGFTDGPGPDPGTWLAIWTLNSPIEVDELQLKLNASSVQDLSGEFLDGEWDNPVDLADPQSDLFPSGDSVAGGDFQFNFNVDIQLSAGPPQVLDVGVSGSGWGAGLVSSLGPQGYSIPVGAGDQLQALPWTDINQIHVLFSEAVTVGLGDLTLSGINVPSYSLSGLTTGPGPDPGTWLATWTLNSPIQVDKLQIKLNASSIQDLSGEFLDGEWVNPVDLADPQHDQFPSGDSAAGGDFQFRFNVLPGNASGDGVVEIGDFTLWADNFNFSVPDPNYDIREDFGGDGTVDIGDFTIWADHFSDSLPIGEPTAPVAPGSASPQGFFSFLSAAATSDSVTTTKSESISTAKPVSGGKNTSPNRIMAAATDLVLEKTAPGFEPPAPSNPNGWLLFDRAQNSDAPRPVVRPSADSQRAARYETAAARLRSTSEARRLFHEEPASDQVFGQLADLLTYHRSATNRLSAVDATWDLALTEMFEPLQSKT